MNKNLSRVYVPHPVSVGEIFSIQKESVHYLRDVLRLKEGDLFCVFHNEDAEYLVRIYSLSKKNGEGEVMERYEAHRESTVEVTLFQGLARGEKMDWIIQKAVELGVSRIQPVLTEYSNVKLSEERKQHKQSHWQSVAVHASEQSGRTRVPLVNAPLPLFSSFEPQETDRAYVLSPHEGERLTSAVGVKKIAIFVGSEGGFSPNEMRWFQLHHVASWCLGKRILRTETAPLTALSILQFVYGDL